MKCPCCGSSSRDDPSVAEVTRVLVADPHQHHSLAGVHLKFSLEERLQLRCTVCSWRILGTLDSDRSNFLGDPTAMVWPPGRVLPAGCPACGERIEVDGKRFRCTRCTVVATHAAGDTP